MEGYEKIQAFPIGNPYEIEAAPTSLGFYSSTGKRIFDLTFALLLLPILLPLIAGLWVLIRLTSSGPAIYKSERIGRHRKRFQCFKLRTMCLDADKKLGKVLEQNPELRLEYQKYCKLKDDPRITSLGKFLRITSLDELPQIFNVLRGEMSLVGPRPVPLDELIQNYGDKSSIYEKVLPGITGLWQISGRSDLSYAERIQLDELYTRQYSFPLDLKIILKTIPTALAKKGAY